MLKILDFKNRIKEMTSVKLVQKEDIFYIMSNPQDEAWSHYPHTESITVEAYREIEPGIYETDLNFEYIINSYSDVEIKGMYGYLDKKGKPIERDDINLKNYDQHMDCYGVADNVKQIKKHYKEAIESENDIVITVTEIRKSDQPEEGGWRWHKWGKYIGKQKPQHEYLADEENIESVYIYHVYGVSPKLKNTLELENDKTEDKNQSKVETEVNKVKPKI